jgi:transposase
MTEFTTRKRISDFWQQHSSKGKPFTVHHFLHEGISRSTIYEVLRKVEERGDMTRMPGSGGHNKRLSNSQRGAIARWLENKKGVSLRQQAKKYGVSDWTIRNVIHERGLCCYKRQKAPQYTTEQLQATKTKAGKLLPVLRNKKIIMDDETYFRLKCDYIPGNDHFYTSDVNAAPPEVKYRTERKFPIQLMVWLCVSEDAVGSPVFLERPNSVTAVFYQDNCIRGPLVDFIHSHHQHDEIIFWPDLASAHYANDSQALLRNLNIPFVPKDCNPPNLPQCRPIENFWAALKAAVYEGGWEATSIAQLKRRIKKCLASLPLISLKRDFASIRKRLRLVNRLGPLAVV